MTESPRQPNTRKPLDRWVFARIDEIHAAALRWRDELITAADGPDIAEAVAAQMVRMPQIETIMISTFADLRRLEISEPLQVTEANNDQVIGDEWIAGSLADLELIWKSVQNLWPPNPAEPVKAIARMKQCAQHLDEIVFHCLQLTLTPNINDILENIEIGHELDVEFVFGDDFPKNPDLRKRLILEVAQEREVLTSALVDPVRGVIYRLPSNEGRWRRYFSVPFLVLFFFGVVAALPWGRALYDSWPFGPEQRYRLMGGYALWIIGAIAHVLIQALRQSQASTVPAFAVMDNWALWISVKQRSILLGTLWISVGFLLLICLSHDLDWKTMLLAGYSSDSLTDLFVQRFQLAADTAKKSVVTSITPASDPPAT